MNVWELGCTDGYASVLLNMRNGDNNFKTEDVLPLLK